MEHEDRDLLEHESNLDKAFFDLNLQIRRLLSDRATPSSTKEAKSGIKLPKMNVPTFDGNILKRNTLGSNLTWQYTARPNRKMLKSLHISGMRSKQSSKERR